LKTKNLTSTNDKELVVNGRSEVLEYVPTALNPDAVCSFFIVLYSLPQSGSDPEKRAGNLYSVYFRYPDSPHLKYNLTHNLTVDSTSGLGTVVVRLMVGESRWKALPPINTLRVALARTGGTVIGVKQHTSSLKVSAAKLVYDFVFKNIKPLPSVKEYYSVQASQTPKQGYPIVQSDGTIQHIQVRFLPRHPNEVRNLTFDHYLNIVDGQFVANASWLGPAAPQGKVREYIYILSSPSASVVIENKLLAEGRPFASNMSYEVTVQIAVEFKNHEYFNFSVRAVSEWGAYGEWTNMTVTPDFPPGPSLDNNLGLPPHVEGIIIGASILIVILIVTFIGLASTGGYYYYKKNKVVIVKNTGIWINGRHDSTGEEGEDGEDFQPVPVDSWEISPDIIIMDSMLGEGQFGEVYKGMIQDGCHHVRASNSKYVAVKILRPEASAALKSDFLKEIVTMKKITMGGCPHVVNMVGCSTLQEPIALVIEYISHGDLLTYLRTIRKLNNSSYCNFHSIESIRAKGNEYVNHGTGPSTPVTPMTPASNCPLLEKEPFSSPTSEEPTPYEKPYSSLGDLKPVDLVSFAYQIATGMEYLANLGIVHRDLACRNVLVGENKVLKISDFGMARDEDIYIKTTDGKLPLRWMAIESIVDRVFTTQSDVWSYGIVLWEITTLGGHPYPSVSNKALLTQLLRGYRMEKPENCSSELYEIMMNCWQVEVSDRPTFAELHTSLDILLTNAQSENYIDLNVDEMLPYYQVSSVQGDEEEMEEKDINPSNGYPDKTGLNHDYLQGDRRPVSNASGSSISSHNVSMQTANEREHSTVSTEGSKEEEQAPTDSNPSESKQTPTDINPNEVEQTPTETNPSERKQPPTDTNSNDSEVKQTPTNTNPDEMKQTSVSIPQDHSTLTFSVPEECSEC
jgi:serine/threonine protein kinase